MDEYSIENVLEFDPKKQNETKRNTHSFIRARHTWREGVKERAQSQGQLLFGMSLKIFDRRATPFQTKCQ